MAPKSQMGQLVMILYSLLAIPLMTMFLLNIGGAVADCVRFLYNRGCCYLCWRKRETTHGKWPPQKKGDKVAAVEEGKHGQAWDGKDPKVLQMSPVTESVNNVTPVNSKHQTL